MNILRPPIEKCCVEKCNPSFPWKYVIQDAALSNIQGESMSGYKKCQLLPLDMLLCYNVVVSVRKDRLQDLSSLLTKTFSSFFFIFSLLLLMHFQPKAVLPCAFYVSFPCSSHHLQQPACMSVFSVIRSSVMMFLLLSPSFSYCAYFLLILYWYYLILGSVFWDTLYERCTTKDCGDGLQMQF